MATSSSSSAASTSDPYPINGVSVSDSGMEDCSCSSSVVLLWDRLKLPTIADIALQLVPHCWASMRASLKASLVMTPHWPCYDSVTMSIRSSMSQQDTVNSIWVICSFLISFNNTKSFWLLVLFMKLPKANLPRCAGALAVRVSQRDQRRIPTKNATRPILLLGHH